MDPNPVVAYFSMEIGLEPSVPTYSGGLGVLAGDMLRSAADLGVPMVGVTLLHRHGYFHQRLDPDGNQREEAVRWPVDDRVRCLDARATIELEGRSVDLRAWEYRVHGITGAEIPVYLLDADLPENAETDRRLTDALYGGDDRYRLCQETLLGIGGVALLGALGYERIHRFHLNEGHAALIVVALLEELLSEAEARPDAVREALERVRERCVFTTHTPVSAGHDRFHRDLAQSVLGERRCELLRGCLAKEELNMTELALCGARFVNGVAMKHGEISRGMFPDYPIHSITNGVHVATWASPPFQKLYDRFLPAWRRDAFSLRSALGIPTEEIWSAHMEAKRELIDWVNREANAGFDEDVLTLGFARRATAYKRASLIFDDLDRLRRIAADVGGLQLVFAGKAHPRDEEGKAIIRSIHGARDALDGSVPVAYLANYDMALARVLCAGSDVWLNTPLPPMEASGTSGMKAAVNGVPSLSVLDGWWVEGFAEGLTGWKVDRTGDPASDESGDAEALYRELQDSVAPCFYREPERFREIMRHAIAHNAAFFNAERMLSQYLNSAYEVQPGRPLGAG